VTGLAYDALIEIDLIARRRATRRLMPRSPRTSTIRRL